MARPIPEGTPAAVPHLVVKDGAAALDFYKKAFGAEEVVLMTGPGGKGVMHAELRFGDARVYLADEWPGMPVQAPGTLAGTSFTLHLWFEDVDAAWERAVAAGARPVMPLADAFWGDRYGQVLDPEGHVIAMACHKEDLTPEQVDERAAEFFASMPPPPPAPARKPRRRKSAKKAAKKATARPAATAEPAAPEGKPSKADKKAAKAARKAAKAKAKEQKKARKSKKGKKGKK